MQIFSCLSQNFNRKIILSVLNKHDNFTINDNIRHVKENRIAVYICTAVPDVKASYKTKKKNTN